MKYGQLAGCFVLGALVVFFLSTDGKPDAASAAEAMQSPAAYVPPAFTPESRELGQADIERLVDELSNWGRWGPDDELGAATANLIGADRLVWAFDYPHSDSCEEPVVRLKESLASLSEEDAARVMGGNARGIYGL